MNSKSKKNIKAILFTTPVGPIIYSFLTFVRSVNEVGLSEATFIGPFTNTLIILAIVGAFVFGVYYCFFEEKYPNKEVNVVLGVYAFYVMFTLFYYLYVNHSLSGYFIFLIMGNRFNLISSFMVFISLMALIFKKDMNSEKRLNKQE